MSSSNPTSDADMDEDFDFATDDDEPDNSTRSLSDALNGTAKAFPTTFIDGFKFTRKMANDDGTTELVKLCGQGCGSQGQRGKCKTVTNELMKWFLCKKADPTTMDLHRFSLSFIRWAIPIIFGKRRMPTTDQLPTTEIYQRMMKLCAKKDEWSHLQTYLPWMVTVITQYLPIKALPPSVGCKRKLDEPERTKTKKARIASHSASNCIKSEEKQEKRQEKKKEGKGKGKKENAPTNNLKNYCVLWCINLYHLYTHLDNLDDNEKSDISAHLAKFTRPFAKMVTVCMPEKYVTERWVKKDEISTRNTPMDSQLFVSDTMNIARLATR